MDNNTQPNKDEENLGSFYMGRMRPPPEPKRLLPPGILGLIAFVLLGGIVWYAYPRGAEKYTNVDVPVVKADTAPIKETPADPGGMEVRHQDSTVFSAMDRSGQPETERLLPASSEEPMALETAEAKPPVPSDTPPQLDLKPQENAEVTEKIVPPAPVAAPKVEEPKAEPKKVEAKAAPKKEEAKKVASSVAAAGDYEVRLGSYPDMSALNKDWDRLRKKFSAQLGGLTMRAVKADIPGKGVYNRLQAGPLTKEKAQSICDALKAANAGCLLAKK